MPDQGHGPFQHNVVAWERAYPGYLLQADALSFIAWRRNASGRKSGRPVRARTLDELAGLIDQGQGDSPPSPALP
jgi:hypothetical protein